MTTLLTPDQNARLRVAARQLVEKFGNQSAVEEVTGLDQTWLSRLINGKANGSYRSAAIIARELGVGLETILGKMSPTQRLSEFDGYEDTLAMAKLTGLYPDTVWDNVGDMIIAPLDEVTVPILLQVAGLVQATGAKRLSAPPRPSGRMRTKKVR